MSNIQNTEARKLPPGTKVAITLASVAVALSLWAIFGDSGDGGGGKGEPSAKSFDRFSFHNASDVPVTNVRLWLQVDESTIWEGYNAVPIPDVQPGETRTLVITKDSLVGVKIVTVAFEYDDPNVNFPGVQRKTIELRPFATHTMTTADVWLGRRRPEDPEDEPLQIAGSGTSTYELDGTVHDLVRHHDIFLTED